MLKLSLLPFYLILLPFKFFWWLITAFVKLLGKLMWFGLFGFGAIVVLVFLI